MKRLLLIASAAVLCASASAAEREVAQAATSVQSGHTRAAGRAPSLGRLFFTPAERAQLDLARSQKKAPEPATPAEPLAAPQVPQVVTYSGIVRRSDGKALVWVNNRLVEEREALTGLNIKGKVKPDGAMTLQVPQSGGSIEMKVGQSVELHTGKVAERRKSETESKPVTSEPKPEAGDLRSATSPSKPQNGSPEKQAEPPVKGDAGARPVEASTKQATISSSPAK